jgi:hypothetical protein
MPYQMMQTMARMKTKKYDPYIPITERASTGLEDVSYRYPYVVMSTHKPMWYLTPGRAMRTTTIAARNEPRHADTKDCCHVCTALACDREVGLMYQYQRTKPTVTRAEPVFQPTSENWLESQ